MMIDREIEKRRNKSPLRLQRTKKSHSTSSGGCLFVIIVHYGPKYIRRITELNRQLQLLRSSNNQTELRRRGGRNHKLSPKVKAIHSLGLFLLENLICQSCCDSFGRNQSIKEAHNILKIVVNIFVETEEALSL